MEEASSSQLIKKQEIKIDINLNQGIARKINKEESKDEDGQLKHFDCSSCFLKEKYDYFGKDPPFVKNYKFRENVYIIEDPFVPPKRGEYIILGSHCIKCNKPVCRDSNCSFYFDGTYCITCAKASEIDFPQPVKDKLNKIVVS